MSEEANLSGRFFGESGRRDVNVRIELILIGGTSRWFIRPLAGDDGTVIEITDRKVTYHLRQVEKAILRESYRHRAVKPNLKPAPDAGHSGGVVAVVCPNCMGYRPFDCPTCGGSGFVPRRR